MFDRESQQHSLFQGLLTKWVKWVSEVSLDDLEFYGQKIIVIVKANKFKIEKFLLPEYFLSFSSCNPTKTLVFI